MSAMLFFTVTLNAAAEIAILSIAHLPAIRATRQHHYDQSELQRTIKLTIRGSEAVYTMREISWPSFIHLILSS